MWNFLYILYRMRVWRMSSFDFCQILGKAREREVESPQNLAFFPIFPSFLQPKFDKKWILTALLVAAALKIWNFWKFAAVQRFAAA